MRLAAWTVFFITLPLTATLADVYRSVDATGQVQYSDTPTPGSTLVRISNPRVSISAPPTPAASGDSSDPAHERLTQDAAARAVQKDIAQTRNDQCKKAQEAYNQSIQARRIYKTGKDGEREYLSDADADQMRLNARLEMEAACKSSQ